jgi:predicted flap endonuclease-1-like 5' DNA nuclease
MELVTGMQSLHGYWVPIIIAVTLLVILALLVFGRRQRVQLTDSAPVRPHMARSKPPEGRGLAGEAAAATSDVTGELLRAPVRQTLDGGGKGGDDLTRLKGVGPKFADALNGAGFHRFEQLAGLSPTEVERLDERLGTFAGRINRDRIVEQADYLARGDTDGFEQRFGKL